MVVRYPFFPLGQPKLFSSLSGDSDNMCDTSNYESGDNPQKAEKMLYVYRDDALQQEGPI